MTKGEDEEAFELMSVEGLPINRARIIVHGNHPKDDDRTHLLEREPRNETPPHETNVSRSAAHNPVPAVIVFGRNAAPLHLPALDAYLSKLPAATFTKFPLSTNTRLAGLGMFPPMDRLAASQRSLQDLEYNATVRPSWRNRNSVLGGLVNLAIGITGSSAVSSFYSLQGILDTIQIFALLLSTIVPNSLTTSKSHAWRLLLLGTIPNVLALNFGTTLTQSLVFFLIFMVVVCVFLYLFWTLGNKCKPSDTQEGLLPCAQPGPTWSFILVSFILTVLYLPMSTIATHALVWSDDFWPVPNPYTNATTFPPEVPPLGPSNEFRDPLDFCYTTTMRRNEVNFTPYVLVAAFFIFIVMTIWFPLRLRRVISQSLPQVDLYTELGRRRSKNEMDREYQRLLARDRQPLSFLYDDYRRGWGTYRSFYLFAKFSALIIIAVINPDNCWFRSLTRTYVSVTRQSVLVCAMVAFFVLQCIWAPFIDPVSNASEWVSRINYLLTSLVGLGVALNMPGQSVLNGPIIYMIYIITYGFSGYFVIINLSSMHRLVKRLSGRLDFSIDIFSPRIDLSRNSPHLKRRIWQETISTVFLTSPECQIPAGQRMAFAISKDFEYPPYLLNFRGSPAERHVENLKILREVGMKDYMQGLETLSGSDCENFRRVQDRIQKHHVGPDCYWKEGSETSRPLVISHFGTAWWIPFPPTLVLRYDDGPTVALQDLDVLVRYISQNRSVGVERKRRVRLALRALDGQTVHWPFEYRQPIGRHQTCCCGRRYQARAITKFQSAGFGIKRRGSLLWGGLKLGSGFDVVLTYSKKVVVDGDVVGIDSEWELTPQLAQFLALNHSLISRRLPIIEHAIQEYREHCWQESIAKAEVLTYRFLISAYNKVQEPGTLMQTVMKDERDIRVRQTVLGSEAAFLAGFERHRAASSCEVAAWWYIFWDDLWRRNHDTVKAMALHSTDFDPHYPSSIAYKPISRALLESFLLQRGLYSSKTKNTDFFHSGFLNKLYFRLNEIVFKDSKDGIVLHLGEGNSEFALDDIDTPTHGRRSSLGTGGGTDHDDSEIRPRPNYRWEGILEDPLLPSKAKQRRRGWHAKLQVWLGLSPLWRTGVVSKGLALDVELVNGKYELLDCSSGVARSS